MFKAVQGVNPHNHGTIYNVFLIFDACIYYTAIYGKKIEI